MENLNCIFCNTENPEIFINENGYHGRKCSKCNLIYISPRPSLNEIIEFVDHEDANIAAKSRIKSSYSKVLHAKHNLNIIKKYKNHGKILEIGAGAGYFLIEAKKRGYDAFGIELNRIEAAFIREELNIPCEVTLLNENSFNDNKFDIIYHCDVLSHFYNPIIEFEKIRFKLNENGYVIFETGNLGDVNKKYFKYIKKFYYPEHLFFFSETSIKKLLEKTGFEIVKTYNYSITPQLFINSYIFSRLASRFKTSSESNSTQGNRTSHINKAKRGYFKLLLKNSYFFVLYFLRYKIGSIVPKKTRPQTIIVIGRKIK